MKHLQKFNIWIFSKKFLFLGFFAFNSFSAWAGIHSAVYRGDYKRTVELVSVLGVNINAKSLFHKWTALHNWALSARTNTKILEFLIENGADINAVNDRGETALHVALWRRGHSKTSIQKANLLIENGADINVKDRYGLTALHLASRYGYLEIVKTLLEKGVDVNTETPSGWTPLHGAVVNRKLKTAKLLIENGADINRRSNDNYRYPKGHTPVELATRLYYMDGTHKLFAEDLMNWSTFATKAEREKPPQQLNLCITAFQ